MASTGARLLGLAALLVLALAAAPAASAAPARHILDLDTQNQPAQLLDWGDFRVDTTGRMTLEQVLADTAAFRPTRVPPTYALGEGHVLWIRIAIPATVEDQRWYLKLPSPGLDSAILYTQTADGQWQPQASGDQLPISRWPIAHLYPVLPLQVSAADPTFHMLRVHSSDTFAAPPEFVSESRLSAEIQRLSLAYGAFFGLLAVVALIALATSAWLRDAAFLWFGIWAATSLLAAMATLGVAGLHLWPDDPALADAAQYSLPVLSAAPLLMLVAEALLLRERARRVFWGCAALAVLCTGAAVATHGVGGHDRLVLAILAFCAGVLAAFAVAVWSRWRGNRTALQFVMATLPMALVLLPYAAVLRNIPVPGFDTPVAALLALGLAIASGYMVLALRSQERWDHRRRIAQLGEIDPTTGLVNEAVFTRRLQALVGDSQRFGHQSVVAMIDFSNLPHLRQEFGRQRSVEMLLRLAKRLSAMLRNVDTLARLGETRFGILVEGPLAASRAKSFCAKVIAQCITPMSGLPQGMVAKPKIALALVPEHGIEAAGVLTQLEELLAEVLAHPARSIAILDSPGPRSVPQAPASTGADSISTAPTMPFASEGREAPVSEPQA
jgi:diguanylate cyclase (GGDEF)-like protein